MNKKQNWTEESPKDFVFYIASDFVDKLEDEMKESGLSKKGLAKRLGVSAGRVSQIFHNPGNLTLEMIVRCARAVGIKVAVLAYNDGDKGNVNGPIIPEVFYECWNRSGNPKNMFDLMEGTSVHVNSGFLEEIGAHNVEEAKYSYAEPVAAGFQDIDLNYRLTLSSAKIGAT